MGVHQAARARPHHVIDDEGVPAQPGDIVVMDDLGSHIDSWSRMDLTISTKRASSV
jgi:hypothetical protein